MVQVRGSVQLPTMKQVCERHTDKSASVYTIVQHTFMLIHTGQGKEREIVEWRKREGERESEEQ